MVVVEVEEEAKKRDEEAGELAEAVAFICDDVFLTLSRVSGIHVALSPSL
jgi:hypothetical protein